MVRRKRDSLGMTILAGSLLMGSILVLLGACASTPTTPAAKTVDLEGLWLVTPGPNTSYGAGGITTLEFGADSSGSATYLSRSSANDITTCRLDIYAALTDKVVLLNGDYYQATSVNADHIELGNGTDELTLDRITGTPPVPPCAQATVTQVGSHDAGTGSFTTLNAVGPLLYFNVDDDRSIVAFDTVEGTFGTPRVYSRSVSGGIHRFVIGARSDDLFYGQCSCGGSTSVDYFDLAGNSSITDIDTDTDLGVGVSLKYGYVNGATVVVGGRARDTAGRNALLTLDSDTLALQSQRQILDEVYVQDVTLLNGELLALVRGAIVVVAADGRAGRTITLPVGVGHDASGITAIGSDVYLLAEDTSEHALLFEVTLP